MRPRTKKLKKKKNLCKFLSMLFTLLPSLSVAIFELCQHGSNKYVMFVCIMTIVICWILGQINKKLPKTLPFIILVSGLCISAGDKESTVDTIELIYQISRVTRGEILMATSISFAGVFVSDLILEPLYEKYKTHYIAAYEVDKAAEE